MLRAFSFAAYALAAGADRFILMDDLDEALRTARSIPRALVGKDGPPRDDFDLFNSPGQLRQRDDIAGRTIVHRTGAGTVGAVAARAAAHVYCASFVVAGATIDRLRVLQEQEITFVITGDQGHAEEDLACAEYMAASLGHATVDPHPFLARAETAGERLQRAAAVGYPGVTKTTWDCAASLTASTSRFERPTRPAW